MARQYYGKKRKKKKTYWGINDVYIYAGAILVSVLSYTTDAVKKEYPIMLWFLVLSASAIKLYASHRKKYKYLHMTQEQIDVLDGKDFEKYLKPHFEKMGYRVDLTPDSNDYGADLLLSDRKEKIVVQAKRYSGKVGNKAVQEVVGAMMYYKCDRAMVVTNSFFTPNAINLAERCDVELWDRNRLKKEFGIK